MSQEKQENIDYTIELSFFWESVAYRALYFNNCLSVLIVISILLLIPITLIVFLICQSLDIIFGAVFIIITILVFACILDLIGFFAFGVSELLRTVQMESKKRHILRAIAAFSWFILTLIWRSLTIVGLSIDNNSEQFKHLMIVIFVLLFISALMLSYIFIDLGGKDGLNVGITEPNCQKYGIWHISITSVIVLLSLLEFSGRSSVLILYILFLLMVKSLVVPRFALLAISAAEKSRIERKESITREFYVESLISNWLKDQVAHWKRNVVLAGCVIILLSLIGWNYVIQLWNDTTTYFPELIIAYFILVLVIIIPFISPSIVEAFMKFPGRKIGEITLPTFGSWCWSGIIFLIVFLSLPFSPIYIPNSRSSSIITVETDRCWSSLEGHVALQTVESMDMEQYFKDGSWPDGWLQVTNKTLNEISRKAEDVRTSLLQESLFAPLPEYLVNYKAYLLFYDGVVNSFDLSSRLELNDSNIQLTKEGWRNETEYEGLFDFNNELSVIDGFEWTNCWIIISELYVTYKGAIIGSAWDYYKQLTILDSADLLILYLAIGCYCGHGP